MNLIGENMPLFKTTRKVQLFGSSLALTIPAMYAKINDIQKGERLSLFYDLEGILVLADCTNEEELKECLIGFIKSLEDKISQKRR
jgi:hypothetical protein